MLNKDQFLLEKAYKKISIKKDSITESARSSRDPKWYSKDLHGVRYLGLKYVDQGYMSGDYKPYNHPIDTDELYVIDDLILSIPSSYFPDKVILKYIETYSKGYPNFVKETDLEKFKTWEAIDVELKVGVSPNEESETVSSAEWQYTSQFQENIFVGETEQETFYIRRVIDRYVREYVDDHSYDLYDSAVKHFSSY